MPGRVDLVFACLIIAVMPAVEYTYLWPRFRRDVAAGRPGTRTRAYRQITIGDWVFALLAIAIWAAHDRPWSGLSLSIAPGWRFLAGVAIDLAVLGLMVVQVSSVARLSADQRVAARSKLASLEFMLPRSRGEYRWFLALSVTAGVCEELLYRGYLPWLFAPWLGTAGAFILAVIIFGVGHIYQGVRGAAKATFAGAVLAVVVVATRSLLPAMLLHALVDAGSGTVGYQLLRNLPPSGISPDAGDGTALDASVAR